MLQLHPLKQPVREETADEVYCWFPFVPDTCNMQVTDAP